MIPLLSSFYFGSVEHYRLLARHPKVVIDTGEHFEKQSYRTRTDILGPNGTQSLNVAIRRDHGAKMQMHTVGLSYVETWPQQHLHALRSAYGRSPWALHFMEAIEGVLLQRHDRLVELDLATLRLGLKWLGLTTEIEVRDRYVEDTTGLLDLRRSFHPKRALPPGLPATDPYPQVFADRHGFVARLSVIDLMCNSGPDAKRIVRA